MSRPTINEDPARRGEGIWHEPNRNGPLAAVTEADPHPDCRNETSNMTTNERAKEMTTLERKVYMTTRRGFVPGRLMSTLVRPAGSAPANAIYPMLRAVSESPYDSVAYYDEFGRLIDTKEVRW
jgi:hypothetical protein